MKTRKTLAIKQAVWQGGTEWGSDCVLTPEERNYHTHVMGSTQSGKSRFFELNIRQNILAGQGILLVDPAGTLYHRVLKFCAHHRIKKVLLIDPLGFPLPATVKTDNLIELTETQVFASINPLQAEDDRETNDYRAGLVADAIMAAWNDDARDTTRLTKWLTAILYVLVLNKLTLIEAPNFIQKDDDIASFYVPDPEDKKLKDKYPDQYQAIHAIKLLGRLYKRSESYVEDKLESTENRLQFTLNENLTCILGQGANAVSFRELVAENWVILVNLNTSLWAGRFEASLALGALILNSVLACQPKDPFYIYVDEVGYFATRQLRDILSLKLKENFVLHLAHQYIEQLKDAGLYKAVFNNCQCKVVFTVPDPHDLQYMAQSLDYGDEKELRVLEKQYAVIKTPEQPARKVQITTVDDVPEVDIASYLYTLYDTYDFYKSRKDATDLIAARRHNLKAAGPPDGPKLFE